MWGILRIYSDSWNAGLAFSPDGRLLASSSWDETARLWNWRSPDLRVPLEGPQEPIATLVFSDDGLQVLTDAWEGVVRVTDVASGREVARLPGALGPAGADPGSPALTAVVHSQELEVRCRVNGSLRSIWYGRRPDLVRVHPSGRVVALAEGRHLALLAVERDGDR